MNETIQEIFGWLRGFRNCPPKHWVWHITQIMRIVYLEVKEKYNVTR